MKQTGIISLLNPSPRPIERDKVRFFSYEHENLSYTGLAIFKKKFFIWNWSKIFLFLKIIYIKIFNSNYTTKRNNRYVCSTHPTQYLYTNLI